MPKDYYAIVKYKDGFSNEIMMSAAESDDEALQDFKEMIINRGL